MRRLAWSALAALVALPIGPALGPSRAASCGTAGTPTSTIYLPNVTKTLGGPSGWVTPFIVQNVGSAPTTLEISYHRFSDGALVTCRSVPGLLPGTSFADVPNNDADLPDGSQFSVVVRSFGSQAVSVVNEHQGSGSRAEALSYVGLGQGATTVGLPYVAKAVSGWTTTIVIQNLGSATAAVAAAFASADGSRTASLARTIESGRSQFIDPSAEERLASGVEYAGLVTSTQPIAVVVNAHNDAPTAAQPMGFSYNGVAAASGSQYLPYVARSSDGGRTTRVLVQNVGSSAATPTLSFRSSTGTQVSLEAPSAIRPGRSWSFDPRYLADWKTTCPSAGSSVCVAVGQHGLVVSGGSFAVLGMTLSTATAMGMVAQLPATSRLYLPNITRALGGASGWTTPIVLQSAGAASAVLRWYRFADGTLAVTQYVPYLVSGGTVRIDPREVSGLEDGSQYAVVVDAAGGAVAAVLELNDLGGDGAMAYEGIPGTGSVSVAPIPGAISVHPLTASVDTAATLQFTATVTDAAGVAMVGFPLTWNVSPSALGTISSEGLFTAGSTTGSGTVTATLASLSASASVTVSAPVVVYAQQKSVDGFVIKASAKVRPAALDEAARQFALLLRGDQTIVERMRSRGVEVAVIAQSEAITDLPEYVAFRGKKTADGRPYEILRGLGGQPCVAAEENLLGLPGDLYPGYSLLLHECGHTVRSAGFDIGQRERWQAIYAAARAAGRWAGTYAGSNELEFFAELTASFFGLNSELRDNVNGVWTSMNGPTKIATHEPEAYRFLLDVYGAPPRTDSLDVVWAPVAPAGTTFAWMLP